MTALCWLLVILAPSTTDLTFRGVLLNPIVLVLLARSLILWSSFSSLLLICLGMSAILAWISAALRWTSSLSLLTLSSSRSSSDFCLPADFRDGFRTAPFLGLLREKGKKFMGWYLPA